MIYHYFRFIIIFAMVVVVFFFFVFIQPHWHQVKHLQYVKEKLDREVFILFKTMKSKSSHLDQIQSEHHFDLGEQNKSGLTRLISLAYDHHLHFQSIQPVQQEKMNHEEVIHFEINDSFDPIMAFLFALQKEKNYTVFNFSFKILNRDQLVFSGDVLILPGFHSFIASDESNPFYNPFCVSLKSLIKREDKAIDLPLDSLKWMKMVGYIKQDQRVQAFILLPDGRAIAVWEGFVFGRENAVITDIQENEIKITTSNKKILSIHM